MTTDSDLQRLAAEVGKHLLASRRVLVTAESCTGGWIGKALTDVPGSSAWFAGGAVVYSNQFKRDVLGIDSRVLAKHGAVSEATVRSMAENALEKLGGDVAVAVSGVAGPDGGTPDKPVGTVWLAWSRTDQGRMQTSADRQLFVGDREQVRRQAVRHALQRILEL